MQSHQIQEQESNRALMSRLARANALAERVSHENSYLVRELQDATADNKRLREENQRLRAELHARRTEGEVD